MSNAAKSARNLHFWTVAFVFCGIVTATNLRVTTSQAGWMAVAATLCALGTAFRVTWLGEGGDHRQIGWEEAGIAVALTTLPPSGSWASVLIGVGIARLVSRAPIEVAFSNASCFAIPTLASAAIFGSPIDTQRLDARIGSIAAVLFLNHALVWAILRSRGQTEKESGWLGFLVRSGGASAVAALVGLVAVELQQTNPFLLIPMAGLGSLLVTFNRQNVKLADRLERTAQLYAFTRSLTGATQARAPALLSGALTRAVRAELVEVVISKRAGYCLWFSRSEVGESTQELRVHQLPDHLQEAMNSPVQKQLRVDGASVVTTPLLLDRRIVGAISLSAPNNDSQIEFQREDLELINTMAQHAAVWLDNGRLFDDLQDESATREYQALHDSLTGLPNRRLFQERAVPMINESFDHRFGGAVLLLDLDNFKEVNDALGHSVGDEVLIQCAHRLRTVVPARAVLARLGGDEFAIVLPDMTHREEAMELADSISASLGTPLELENIGLRVDVSIGVSYFPSQAVDAATALQRADVAMYHAKEHHTGTESYDSNQDFSSAERLGLHAELQGAIGSNQIQVWYQPKVRLSDNKVTGVEALVRWKHPRLGLVMPDKFIPAAEQSGIIGPLTMQILEESLRQQRLWRSSGLNIRVAVNLSVRSLLNADLADAVRTLLNRYGASPGDLVLEITETAVMSDPHRAKVNLAALDAMGVHLAVDDFGVGQSSLAYISELPIREIKIDRLFVARIENDGGDGIARTVIDLGRNLNMLVVAEGVEGQKSFEHLRAIGCAEAQGYFIGRPMNARLFNEWIANGSGHLPQDRNTAEFVGLTTLRAPATR